MALAIRKAELPEQAATYGGAFGTGILLGWVTSRTPAWGTGLTLAAAGGGAIGALMTRGFASQMLEGVGAAAMGALGSSIPYMLKGAARMVGPGPQALGGRPAPKQLASPTTAVGQAIAAQVRGAVGIEF